MDFHFSAYTSEELVLAARFLESLAALQQRRQDACVKDSLAQTTYPFEGNLRPPGSVAAGMPMANLMKAPWNGESG
jgi:hypothetical protein